MFSLLSKADSSCALAEGLKWQQELVAADTAQQQDEPSFLDRLAAPTVFMQQALLFDTSLNVDVLRVAVAAVAQCFPPFGYRLTEQVSTVMSYWYYKQATLRPPAVDPKLQHLTPARGIC
jgi:hypothetical protein